MKKNKLFKVDFLIYLSFLFLTLVQIKPFITKNLMVKDWGLIYDRPFHIARLISLDQILYHPINYQFFFNTGIGTNYFYPWIFLYPSNLIGKTFNNYSISFISIFMLITFSAFLICFYCGQFFFESKKSSYLFSVVYSFSVYRIQNGYIANSMGQFIVSSFLPLVFLFWYRIVFKKESKWVGLSVSMSLIIFSHVLTTMLTIIYLIFLSIIYYKKTYNCFVLVNLGKSIFLTFVLTSFFWVVSIQQSLIVGILPPYFGNLQASPSSLNSILQLSIDNNISSTCGIGIFSIITMILATFLINNSTKIFKFFYFSSLITILISSNLFPWFLLQSTPVKIIQSPNRLTLFVNLFLSILLVLVLKELLKFKNKNIIFISFLIILVNFSSSVNFLNYKNQDKSILILNSNDIKNIGLHSSTGDYMPRKTANKLNSIDSKTEFPYIIKQSITDKESFINHKKADIKPKFTADKVSIDWKSNTKTSILDIPVYYYEGTYAKIDGKRTSVKESDRGTVEVKVPKNTHKVEITNEYTPLAKTAAVISIVSWLSVLGVYLKKKFKK